MTFVFLHIDKGTQESSIAIDTFVRSIEIFFPKTEIIQVTDNKTKKINNVNRVFRFDGDTKKIMKFRIDSNRELKLKKPAIYLDSDMVIANRFDLNKLLNFEKEILLKRSFDLKTKFNINTKNLSFEEFHGRSINDVFPILACFIKTNSYLFWEEMSRYLKQLEEKFLFWYADQEILKKIYLEDKKRFYLLEEKLFACPPQFIDKKAMPFLLHFKGLNNKSIFLREIKLINNYLDKVKLSL